MEKNDDFSDVVEDSEDIKKGVGGGDSVVFAAMEKELARTMKMHEAAGVFRSCSLQGAFCSG